MSYIALVKRDFQINICFLIPHRHHPLWLLIKRRKKEKWLKKRILKSNDTELYILGTSTIFKGTP